jgi:tRNA(fMet)-specific endonuclease VapC
MAQPQYLLDTNICIYIRRERPQTVLERFKVLPPGSTAISVITYGELIYGVQKSPDPRKAMMILEELTALIPIVPMAIEVAQTYGAIRSDLAARGELAAHARSLDLILVTNNESEFKRVEGLAIENWARG